ncbi:MAG TPA: lasso peptide biosynthesis B2 protein [Bryobacteraceae bacterium]|nr:lasso peptide biosynthesis B2 protein [Bryobacteraceae bacterium]
MNRFAKFVRLSHRRRILLLRVWLALNVTAVALRFVPLPQILKWFGTNPTSPSRPKATSYSKDEIVWTVRAAAALSMSATCVVRALVGERLLRAQGYSVQFKVGVRPGEDFQAHAWVEDEHGILIGESERPYHPLPDLSASDLATPS